MASSIHSDLYRRFREALVAERRKAGLTQKALAERVGQPQPFISKIETGERRVDVAEFIELSTAIGFDPCDLLRSIMGK